MTDEEYDQLWTIVSMLPGVRQDTETNSLVIDGIYPSGRRVAHDECHVLFEGQVWLPTTNPNYIMGYDWIKRETVTYEHARDIILRLWRVARGLEDEPDDR